MEAKDDERSVNWAPDQIKAIWERIHQLHGIIGEWKPEEDDESNTMAEELDAIQRRVRRRSAEQVSTRRQIREIHRTIGDLDQGTNQRLAAMERAISDFSELGRRLSNVESYYVTEARFNDLIRRVRNLEEKVKRIQESSGEAQRGIETTLEALAEEVAGMKPYTELDFRVKAIEDGLSAYGVPFKGPGFTPKFEDLLDEELAGTDKAVDSHNQRIEKLEQQMVEVKAALLAYGASFECPGDGCRGCTGCEDKIPQFGVPWANDEPERSGGVVREPLDKGAFDRHMPGAEHNVWKCRHADCINTRSRLSYEDQEKKVRGAQVITVAEAEKRIAAKLVEMGWSPGSPAVVGMLRALRGQDSTD